MKKFSSKAHEAFFYTMLSKAGNTDSYHQALFYTIGISSTMRQNVDRIFNFKEDCIIPEALSDGWQTGSTARTTRLAFNLWNNFVVEGFERHYTPEDLFACSYAPYFFEAIKLRYPEYCRDINVKEAGR